MADSQALANVDPVAVPAHLKQYADTVTNIGARMPILKLRNRSAKQKGVKTGEYFIVKKTDDDEEIINLGESFKGIILRHAIVAQEYNKKENRMDFYTSEFKDWQRSPLIVFDRTDGDSKIAAFTTWSGENGRTIKQLREGDKRFGGIKTSRVCYVFLPEQNMIAQMNIGNRDWNGCDKDGNCDYNTDPIEGSFGHYIHMTNQYMKGAPFCALAEISTRKFDTVDDDGETVNDYAKYFDVGRVFKLDDPMIATADGKVSQAIVQLTEFLIDRLENNISFAMKNTESSNVIFDIPVRLEALKKPYECASVLMGIKPKDQGASVDDTAKALESGEDDEDAAPKHPKKKDVDDEEVDTAEDAKDVFGDGEKPSYQDRVKELGGMKKPDLKDLCDAMGLPGKTNDEMRHAILAAEYPDEHEGDDGIPQVEDMPTSSDKMIAMIKDAGSKSELKRLHTTVLDGCEDESVIDAYDKRMKELDSAGKEESVEDGNDPW